MKLASSLLFACMSIALLLDSCLAKPQVVVASSTIPDTLQVSANEKLAFKLNAVGYQLYKYEKSGWVHKGPSADLYDMQGKKIGTHFGGPTWKAALPNDTSLVVGKPKVVIPATSPDAITWILLDAAPQGTGMFGMVNAIQRLETIGGKTPNVAGLENEEKRIPYAAVYYFYVPK